MRLSRRRLTLFFIVQVLAVAAMSVVASPGSGAEDSRVVVVVSNAAILVELGMIAAALSVNRSAWPPTLAVGFILLALGVLHFFLRTTDDPGSFTSLGAWHLAAGLLLVGAVVLSGAVVLLAGVRRLLTRSHAMPFGDA